MTPVFSLSLQLLPLLLEALSCSDRVVQLSTLSCLHPLLLEAPQVMSLHVNTLVTKFLDLTSSPTMVCTSPPSSLLCPSLLPFVLPSPLSVAGCPHRRSALCPCPHQSAHNSGKCSCSPLLPAPACRGAKGGPNLVGRSQHLFLSPRAPSVLQLLPFKGRVIRALAKPLDDKKRLVRKEAVAARGEW